MPAPFTPAEAYHGNPHNDRHQPDENKIEAILDYILERIESGTLPPKEFCHVATTGNIDLSAARAGDTIDDIVTADGDSVLLWQQTAAAENGVYTFTTGAAPTRRADADAGDELQYAVFSVIQGTENGGWIFGCVNETEPTVGSTVIEFLQVQRNSDLLPLQTEINNLEAIEDADYRAAAAVVNRGPGRPGSGLPVEIAKTSNGIVPFGMDQYGRAILKRPTDPQMSGDGAVFSLNTRSGFKVAGFSGEGVLEGPSWRRFGTAKLNGTNHPELVTADGVVITLPKVAIDVQPAGPGRFAVCYDEPGVGARTVRIHGTKRNSLNGSIFAGSCLELLLPLGQSNVVGRGDVTVLNGLVSPARKGCWTLARKGKTPDERGGVTALDGVSQDFDESEICGFDVYRPVVGFGNYGGMSLAASYLDRKLENEIQDVGEPSQNLVINAGVGGASYSDLKSGTTPFTKMVEMLRRARILAYFSEQFIQVRSSPVVHGESDMLQYSAVAQAGNTGYYADCIEWQTDVTTAIVTELNYDAAYQHRFDFLQPAQRYSGARITSAVAMVDLMRNVPDKFRVVGPGYPILNKWETDQVHYSAEGQEVMGELFAQHQKFVDSMGEDDWRPCYITSVTSVNSTEIDVVFHSPSGTLVKDVVHAVPQKDGDGFCVIIDDGLGSKAVYHPNSITNTGSVGKLVTLRMGFATAIPSSGYTYRGFGCATTNKAANQSEWSQANLQGCNWRDETEIPIRETDLIWYNYPLVDYRPF